MGLGDRLLDREYNPESATPTILFTQNKCPVLFTEDIVEFCESSDYMGLTLRPLQRNFLIDLYEKQDTGLPKHSEGVLVAGMRGGKSALAAMVGAFQLHGLLPYSDPALHFNQLPGYRLTGQFLASSQAQATETAYAAFDSLVTRTSWWKKYNQWLKDRESVEHKKLVDVLSAKVEYYEKNVAVLALHSNSSSLAGKTSFVCIFDELSRLDVAEGNIQGQSQKASAQAIYHTVARAAKSLLPYSKILTITSPMFENDYGMQLLLQAGTFKGGEYSRPVDILRQRGNKVPTTLGYHATTFELNPKYIDGNIQPGGYEEADFLTEKIQNPEAYRRDYLALPPSAVSPFFEYPERIELCTAKDREPCILFEDDLKSDTLESFAGFETRTYITKKIYISKPDLSRKFYLSCDQGEKKDAFVIAMAHSEEVQYEGVNAKGEKVSSTKPKVIVDFVEGWIPSKADRITVLFSNVEDCIREINNYYRLYQVAFDRWSSAESIQRLFSDGIPTKQVQTKLEMYETLKYLIYTGLVELPYNERLLTELRQLNLIKGVKVDHDVRGSNDYADAICRVVWAVYQDAIKEALHGDQILPFKQELPTLRSMISTHDLLNNGVSMQGSIWSGSAGKSVFGKGFEVRSNVSPNVFGK